MAAEPPEVDLASKQDGQVFLSLSPWFAAFLRADLRLVARGRALGKRLRFACTSD